MTVRRYVLILLAMLFISAPAAQAYTGGPALVEILGWDESAQRLYFHTIPRNDANYFGGVYYFDLAAEHKGQRVALPWSIGEADANDPDHVRRLDSLRTRLIPLLPKPEASLGWGTTVVSAEQETVSGRTRPRFRLLFTSDQGPRFECTAYERPDACVKDTYVIPGRQERIYVLAFRGNPNDIAETQVAVFVPTLSDLVYQVEWERDP